VSVPDQYKKVSKYEYLDGLRGLGALSVYLDHFVYISFGRRGMHPLAREDSWIFKEFFPVHFDIPFVRTLLAADFYVMVFFILSGFVMSLRYFKQNKRPEPFRLIIKRYFRLNIPLGLIVTIMYFIRCALKSSPYAYRWEIFNRKDLQ
jgi:peptidoglycan/LPS O-acetylase OafA/YrhL